MKAEILVAAIGRPGFITAEMVRPGATLIDVGINRVTDAAEVARFFPGDAARAEGFAKRGSTVVGGISSLQRSRLLARIRRFREAWAH